MTQKKPQSNKVDIQLENFDFDPKTVQLIHHQFGGSRTNFIRNVDDLLARWGMAGAANPNIDFTYILRTHTEGEETYSRMQLFLAAHAHVYVGTMSGDESVHSGPRAVELANPKKLVKLYDLGFTAARTSAPAHVVASYFSLREAVARIGAVAERVVVDENLVIAQFCDAGCKYLATFKLWDFRTLNEFARHLNEA